MLDQIKTEIGPILEDNDVYLDDIEYVREKNEWYLRIFIDKKEGILDLDTITVVSEQISEKLDEIDVIDNEYYLEVSSPGIEKPLKTLEKIKEAIGEYVFIKVKNPQNGFDQIYGTILDVQEDTILFQYMMKNRKKTCEIKYSNVSFARLAVKF